MQSMFMEAKNKDNLMEKNEVLFRDILGGLL